MRETLVTEDKLEKDIERVKSKSPSPVKVDVLTLTLTLPTLYLT
jgi:hypothetical protein